MAPIFTSLMQKLLPVAIVLFAACGNASEPAKESMEKIAYPETRKDTTVVDDYFGTKVADPYRWLEHIETPAVETWFKQQASYTDSVLNNVKDAFDEKLGSVSAELTCLSTTQRAMTPRIILL